MPVREGHEFLRGHQAHPSARMSLSPATERGFSMGLPGEAHSFRSACRLMTRPQGPVIPSGSRGIGWGDTGIPPQDICVTFETAPPGCDGRAQNRVQRCELG
jgi:hypothetical protein